MICKNADNYLLQFRRLLQQYCVNMYVKIETKRIAFIWLNQAKLHSEEYINLHDATSIEEDAADVGRLTTLPATYTGSARHICINMRKMKQNMFVIMIGQIYSLPLHEIPNE